MTQLMMVWHVIKIAIFTGTSATVGWLMGFLFQVANPEPSSRQPNWYEHPAVIAGVMSTITVFILRWADARKEARKDAHRESKEIGERQENYSEAIADLTQKGWAKYLEEIKGFNEQQVLFLQAKLLDKDIDSYRDREIKHACFGEIQRLQIHIRKLDTILAACCKEVPEFEYKWQNDIIASTDGKVEEYRRNQRDNLRAVSGAADNPEN